MDGNGDLAVQFEMFAQEQAERWAAVHARIGAYRDVVGIMVHLLAERDAETASELGTVLARMIATGRRMGVHSATVQELEQVHRMIESNRTPASPPSPSGSG